MAHVQVHSDVPFPVKVVHNTSIQWPINFKNRFSVMLYLKKNLLWSMQPCTVLKPLNRRNGYAGEKCAMDKIQEESEDDREKEQWVELLRY